MDIPKFIVVAVEEGGYMIAKLRDAAESYYEEVMLGATLGTYENISELVSYANFGYEKSLTTSYSPYDDIF